MPRDSQECRDGEQAYRDGVRVNDCPYPIGDDRRSEWMTGWYDERTFDRLGHIFKRWGLTWP